MWFTLGIREAIKGWDKGLKDMCVGEKRKLTIPPALAYGKEGKGKMSELLPSSHHCSASSVFRQPFSPILFLSQPRSFVHASESFANTFLPRCTARNQLAEFYHQLQLHC